MKPHLYLAALLFPVFAQAQTLGELDFSPCTLTTSEMPTSVNAKCTTLEVPENRDDPDSRKISLAIAWVAPDTGEAEPDPVFLLAGGPGQSAKETYPSVEGAFRDIARHRNVILLDQRGTGESNPLQCVSSEEADLLDDSVETVVKQTRACRETLEKHADLRYYATADAVADLDAVRRAIGADTINLVGVSYGTRVAQQYMKTHPDAVRSVILDGVVPNSLVLGKEHAANLQSALEALFQRCRDIEACNDKLGDPGVSLAGLSRQLRKEPLDVRYRDATSGEMKEGQLGYPMLAALLRMYVYHPQTASTVPLILHQLGNGEADAVMAQIQMLLNSLGTSMAQGMGLSVTCTEDAAELAVNEADADTLLGDDFVRFMKAQCDHWPSGKRADDFREPVRGATPVLLLSGEFDPVTPPRYGDEVASHLDKARHLVLKGQGHNVFGVGCAPKLIAQFIETADPQSPNADCLDRLAVIPPFSGIYGWEP